jgi:hypothetical protein
MAEAYLIPKVWRKPLKAQVLGERNGFLELLMPEPTRGGKRPVWTFGLPLQVPTPEELETYTIWEENYLKNLDSI